MSESAFDPTRYLTKVSGRDYLEVKWRLVWLRSQYPLAKVTTELVEHGNDTAVFRATVTLPPEIVSPVALDTGEIVSRPWSASATGYGSEAIGDFGDYLEKAETKALGRALAALGFGTQFCQDYDFGADQQRVVDAPVNVSGGQRRQPSGSGNSQEATPRQVQFLRLVAREIGLSSEALDERAQRTFGVNSIVDLNRRDISQFIDQLKSEQGHTGLAN